jgi:hypothetical protein
MEKLFAEELLYTRVEIEGGHGLVLRILVTSHRSDAFVRVWMIQNLLPGGSKFIDRALKCKVKFGKPVRTDISLIVPGCFKLGRA